MRAPEVFRNLRRERAGLMRASPGHSVRWRASCVDKAAAKYVLQGLFYVLGGGFWVAIEERFRGEHHAAEAETALRGLLINEGLLQRMRLLRRAQALQGHDFGFSDGADRCNAGASGAAVQQNRAGAALTEAAAEFGAAQLEFVAEHIEQRRGRINIHGMGAAVDFQSYGTHCLLPDVSG